MAVGFPQQAVEEQPVPCHQVFINFRGAELRNNFISFLEPALKTAGINVFVDKNEMRGKDQTVLFSRIEESKIALVVFSRRYMESKWCLNELAKIKERVDEEKLVAIPIFFKVEPSELNGLLVEACNKSHGNVEAHILKKWKMSLECITSKMGLPLKENSKSYVVIGNNEVEQSMYGQLVLGKGVSSSVEEQLVKEVKKAASAEKQRIAEEVASTLKLSVDIDTTSSERLEKIVVALRAAAEYIGLPVKNCVLVAGSQPGVSAAKMIGMPCVVMRSSLTARGEFPSAKGVMDGFGGADLTIPKLRYKIKS